jgi:uncharacterized protein
MALFGRKRGPQPVPFVTVPVGGPSTVTVRFTSVGASDGLHHGLALLLRHGELAAGDRSARNTGQIPEHLLLWAEDGAEQQVECRPSSLPAELVVEGCYGPQRTLGGPNAALVAETSDEAVLLRCSQRPDGIDLTDLVAQLRLAPGEEPAASTQPAPAAPVPAAPAPTVNPGEVPPFRYHPDPVTSGALVSSDLPCVRCRQARGWHYTGPIYTRRDDISEGLESGELALCPWCIADGSAAAAWSATFVEFAPDRHVDDAIRREIETRTPGFRYEYQPRWPVHHKEPCAYLRTVTAANFDTLPADQQDAVRRTGASLIWDPAEHDPAAIADELPGAPLFRCLHCGVLSAHAG